MSDATRAQKLAAARKKLKEFQQKAKCVKKENSDEVSATNPIPHEEEDVMTVSTQSSLSRHSVEDEQPQENVNVSQENQIVEEEPQQPLINENLEANSASSKVSVGGTEPNQASELPIYNYFSNDGFDSAYNQRSNFFDSLADTQQQIIDNENTNEHNGIFSTAVYLDSKLYSNPSLFKNENGNEDLDEMYDNVHKSAVTYNDAKEINNYLDKRDSLPLANIKQEENEADEYFQEKDDKEDCQMLQEISDLQYSEPKKSNQHSNIENLMQLSSQMAQLVDPSPQIDTSEATSKLERRNQELAALLEEEQVKTRQLAAQLNIKDDQIRHLEKTLEVSKMEQETKIKCEMGQIQEQLQNHIQTIGILVAEKTELSAMLSQAQSGCKQKTVELEELGEKLKNSNKKISSLESELNALKTEKTRNSEIVNERSEAYNKLKSEYEELKRTKDELSQDALEVHEKLNASSAENIKLQKQLQEVSAQLSLANIRIQQLTLSDSAQLDAQMELIVQQKLTLEKNLLDLRNALETVTKERDQANTQYQQYALQLNNQLTSLASKLDSATKENEALVTREQNLVRHISELERHLQNVQNDHVANSSQKTEAVLEKDLQDALQNIETLKIEKEQVRENFTRICNERDMLLKDLSSKKDCISELESLVERLQVAQPDTTKLLAELESHKVAAARAISQNNELKKQLQDIQDDFIKMSNDKLELTEQLTREQNLNKELNQKLEHCEAQLQTLADAINIKDHELTEIRNNSNELNKQLIQLNQLADRLRHYEAQSNSMQALQVELEDVKQQVNLLSSENGLLKEALNSRNFSNEEITKPEPQEICEHSANALDRESAMKHLEQKFLKTMQDIANLTEEKQRLEHLVLQLQSETETIGEYIALYQHQRGILKQRALEKDEQLKQLAYDREQIKNKLEQLNNLVKKLVLEKGSLTTEILEQHENFNKHKHELCEEHAKLHQEIGKITDEGIAMGVNGVKDREEHKDETEGRETAEKIIELLSEIKTSSLVQPSENFHPCPWCSGKLITV